MWKPHINFITLYSSLLILCTSHKYSPGGVFQSSYFEEDDWEKELSNNLALSVGPSSEEKETLFEEKQKEEGYIRFLKYFSGYEIVRWVTTLIIKCFSQSLNYQDK